MKAERKFPRKGGLPLFPTLEVKKNPLKGVGSCIPWQLLTPETGEGSSRSKYFFGVKNPTHEERNLFFFYERILVATRVQIVIADAKVTARRYPGFGAP